MEMAVHAVGDDAKKGAPWVASLAGGSHLAVEC